MGHRTVPFQNCPQMPFLGLFELQISQLLTFYLAGPPDLSPPKPVQSLLELALLHYYLCQEHSLWNLLWSTTWESSS